MRTILTGKAKEDFYKFLIKKYPLNEMEVEEWFLSLYNEFKNASITEWFDSVGIYITSDYLELNRVFYSEILNENFEIVKPNRQEALTEAIKKANEIYNSK